MICKKCGTRSENSARVCPACGASLYLNSEGDKAAGLRQGRVSDLPPVFASVSDEDVSNTPSENSAVPVKEMRDIRKKHFNRARFQLILLVFLAIIAMGLLIAAFSTPKGRTMIIRACEGHDKLENLARKFIDDESVARVLWDMGTEQLNTGNVNEAIRLYDKAYAMYPKIDGLYDYLLNLADSYLASGQNTAALVLYQQLYEDIDPTDPRAWRYTISMLQSQNRVFEAASLMKTAYEKTGEISFKSQRDQLMPLSPTATLSAGTYQLERNTELVSSQEYDIYYLLDDETSELPEAGLLYNHSIHLSEGTHTIRAVCVSSQLVSDEVSFKYTIKYPTPSAPNSRLASGEYDTRRRVYLYYTPDADSPNQIITIYYTLDGTAPNSESPVYTDEGFLIFGGKTTLRAVAVNQYGKVSNELNCTYKINIPFRNYFRDDSDQFRSFTVGSTTYSEFTKLYGTGTQQEINDSSASGTTFRVTYEWGEARFSGSKQTLYYVSTNSAKMTGPRRTNIGNTLTEIVDSFRDMGQVANAAGNRSLYNDAAAGTGRYYHESDSTGRVEYTYHREDGGTTTLTYSLVNGKVAAITMGIANGAF